MFLKGGVEAQLGMWDTLLPTQSRYRASPSSACLSLKLAVGDCWPQLQEQTLLGSLSHCRWNTFPSPISNTLSSALCPWSSLSFQCPLPIKRASPWIDSYTVRKLDCEESWVPKNWCFWTVVLEKTSLISLQSRALSRVFSNTTVQKHQFLVLQNHCRWWLQPWN